MKTITVESTLLRNVAYDDDHKLLQLEFQNRAVYRYLDVPPIVYEGPDAGAL